jgi:hypothetical protein
MRLNSYLSYGRIRRPVLAGICAVAFVASLGFLASTVRVWSDIRTVPIQLTVKHAAAVDKLQRAIRVHWCTISDSREIKTPWSPITSDLQGSVYESQATLRIGGHDGYFTSDASWYFDPAIIILVVVDDRHELRFEPRTLFAPAASGDPPRIFSAILDVDEYLSGAKRAPPIEWPVESTRGL